MNRLLLSLMITIFGAIGYAHAQFDGVSKKILDKMSANYQTFNTIEADVMLSADDSGHNPVTNTGKVALERMSGKFKIDLGGQEIISNGATQWTILKDQAEIQVNDANRDDNSLNPATIFTFYKTGYKGNFTGTSKLGNRSFDDITLVPTDTKQNISKIDIRVDKASNLIYDAIVFDKNGGKYIYTIKKLTVNNPIPYSTFIFNKNNYPSMEIVDLR